MIHKPLEEITKADIDALIQNEVREGRTIEYKSTLPGGSDHEKREFLADVSSFANASGGDILYGVVEKRSTDGKHTGYPESATGIRDLVVDEETRRVEHLIRDGTAPRIPNIHVQAVNGFSDGPVLLVRIPKSWASPHMVTFKGLSRFYSRNNAGTYPLDVSEIRSAFALSEALPDRIKRFRDDRLARIVADQTPVPLEPNPRIILHLMPLAAFSSGYQVDLNAIDTQRRSPGPMYGKMDRSRFNVDGFIAWDWGNPPKRCSYFQVFRVGIIEAVDASLIEESAGRKVIPSTTFAEHVLSDVETYIKILRGVGAPPPILVTLALLGVKGYDLAVDPTHWNYSPTPIERDLLSLPDVLLDDYDATVARVIRPIFDGVWNAGGHARCMNYNDNGDWNPRWRA